MSHGKEKQKERRDRKRKPKSYDYFDGFVQAADYTCAAAKILDQVIRGFDVEKLPGQIDLIGTIEHAADTEKHNMVQALAKEFITPIEPEDIAEMAQLLDDVTDSIEDIIVKLFIYDIRALKPEALEFCDIITQMCDVLKATMRQFGNFKKSTLLHGHIVEINRLEGEGDRVYNDAMRNLHVTSKDPIEIMTWSRILDYFEQCCDAFEDVADTAEYIVMKNS